MGMDVKGYDCRSYYCPAGFSPHMTMFQAKRRNNGSRVSQRSASSKGVHHQSVRGVSRRIFFQ